jgi:hypothetical protein
MMHTRLLSVLLAAVLASPATFAQTRPVFTPDPSALGDFIATETFEHLSSGTFADHFDIVPPIPGFVTVRLDADQPAGLSGVIFQGFQITGSSVDDQLVLFPEPLPSNVILGPIRIGGPADLLVGVIAAPAVLPRSPVVTSYTAVFQLSPVSAIPEPQTWALLAASLLALGVVARFVRARRTEQLLRQVVG